MARIVYEGPVSVGTDLDDATEIDLQPGDGARFGVPTGSALDGETVVVHEKINGTWYASQDSSAAASQVVAAAKSYPIPVTNNCSSKIKLVCSALGDVAPVDLVVKSMDSRS